MTKLLWILVLISTLSVSCESEKEESHYTSDISDTETVPPMSIDATIDSMWTEDSVSLILVSASVVNNLKDTIRSLRWSCPPEFCHLIDNPSYKIHDTIACYQNGIGVDYYPPNATTIETFLIQKLDESNSEFKVGIDIFDIPKDSAINQDYFYLIGIRDDNKITFWSNIIKPE